MEKVNPLVITLASGETYELDFSRDSIRFAEARGFKITELMDFPQTNIPAMFYYAFRKNHPNVARNQTDKILFDELGGLSGEELTRLADLYRAPVEALVRTGERKNAKVSVQM